MRLWHYELIPYLPNKQLVAQWRELNSIYVKEDKHILINYIYDYTKYHLMKYSLMVIKEMQLREFKIKSFNNFYKYFNLPLNGMKWLMDEIDKPFEEDHNDNYLKICCWNLYEKYIRGQEGFSKESIKFIKGVINK